MSHTTYSSNHSTKAVCKQCCKTTCCLYIGSDLMSLLAEHKIELFLFIFITSWFITNTVLFAILVNSSYNTAFRSDILLAFGGLALCLPATIYLVIVNFMIVMYCIKIYNASVDEIRRKYYIGDAYELDVENNDPVVKIYPSESIHEEL